MRLLVVTQVVDKRDQVLGFFHNWIEEFAKQVDSIVVICLKEGEHSLPSNVTVYSLGKEKAPQHKLRYAFRFLRLLWLLRREYGHVFVHMNHEYLLIGGWIWRLQRKKIGLWFTHGSVPLTLRLASIFPNHIFTASTQSLRLPTKKKKVMGHGLDVGNLMFRKSPPEGSVTFITVGRISQVKNIHILVDAFAFLEKHSRPILKVIGSSITEQDKEYERQLKEKVAALNLQECVLFLGTKGHQDIQEELANAHAFLHASNTGSLDKAPLEALAVGLPVITVNPEVGEDVAAVAVTETTAEDFASKIKYFMETKPWLSKDIRVGARKSVETNHSLPRLIKALISELSR